MKNIESVNAEINNLINGTPIDQKNTRGYKNKLKLLNSAALLLNQLGGSPEFLYSQLKSSSQAVIEFEGMREALKKEKMPEIDLKNKISQLEKRFNIKAKRFQCKVLSYLLVQKSSE